MAAGTGHRSEREEAGVIFTVFAAPVLTGAAALCLLLRRFLPFRVVVPGAFLAGVGIAAGFTATAMHARGFRIPQLQAYYDAPQRQFRAAMEVQMRDSFMAERSQRNHAFLVPGRAGG